MAEEAKKSSRSKHLVTFTEVADYAREKIMTFTGRNRHIEADYVSTRGNVITVHTILRYFHVSTLMLEFDALAYSGSMFLITRNPIIVRIEAEQSSIDKRVGRRPSTLLAWDGTYEKGKVP